MTGYTKSRNGEFIFVFGCRTDKLDSTTCVIETYRACPDEVFANNNALVPGETRTAIIFEQWGNFKDGAELCGIYFLNIQKDAKLG